MLSRTRWKQQRDTQTGDFSYDPYSYALNFENDKPVEEQDFPVKEFAYRLKHSHSHAPSTNFTKRILLNARNT